VITTVLIDLSPKYQSSSSSSTKPKFHE